MLTRVEQILTAALSSQLNVTANEMFAGLLIHSMIMFFWSNSYCIVCKLIQTSIATNYLL